MATNQQRIRVGGSGYTAFVFQGQPLVFLDVITDTAPRPVAPPEPIQPLDEERPVEIAFAKAVGAGTLVCELREEWGRDIWAQLPGYGGAATILDVFKTNIETGSIVCAKIIKSPSGRRRGRVYSGAYLTDIDESESVRIQTMSLPKKMTVMYTNVTPL